MNDVYAFMGDMQMESVFEPQSHRAAEDSQRLF